MIQLSDMQLAREIERQCLEFEILAGVRTEVDLERGSRYIEATGKDDLNYMVDLMRSRRERLDAQGWGDCYCALFWLMSDEQAAEWKILNAILSRVLDRLHDRLISRADAHELASRAASIVETTGAAISEFSSVIAYKPVKEAGVLSWQTRHDVKLDRHAGPDDEREAYQRAAFSPVERKAFDFHFAESLPPMGMYFTASCIASDLSDRYKAKDGLEVTCAIETAVDVLDWAADGL